MLLEPLDCSKDYSKVNYIDTKNNSLYMVRRQSSGRRGKNVSHLGGSISRIIKSFVGMRQILTSLAIVIVWRRIKQKNGLLSAIMYACGFWLTMAEFIWIPMLRF